VRPTSVSMEINSRHNLASFMFGKRIGTIIVNIHKSPMGLVLWVMWVIGFVTGLISLFGALSPSWAVMAGLMCLPNMIVNCYSPTILELIFLLTGSFEAW
jgi:hypothetical protein